MVEDEPLIRLGVVAMLEDSGYRASEAANADDALRQLENQPGIRLVITDIDMPGSMDGVALAYHVRRRWPPIGIIVISGKFGPSQVQVPEGVHFFSKPYPEHKLLALISALAEPRGGKLAN